MSDAWKGGSTRAHRVARAQVLMRDRYICQIKLPGEWLDRKGRKRNCLGRANCVHHTRGKEATGNDPRYMVAACMPCNLKVGDPTRGFDPKPRPITKW